MSLRCAGLQLLQTVPSTLLDSASTASVSFWVEVNPANNVADPNGVEIFGDSGGQFSATLSGTGSLLLRWSSRNGSTNSVSTCAMTLVPGASCHVAATWQSGWQQYYLNGVGVGSDIKTGSLGVVNAIAPHAYRLGSDRSGTDVTLDQPTIWVGYALTDSDVTNLRDRSVSPSNVAPSSIALAWSLSGQDGVSANIGDSGLVDSSTNLLNLISIVGKAPTYQAGDLTYLPRPNVTAVASASGKSLVLLANDGSGAKTNFISDASTNEVQSIQFPQVPVGNAFALAFAGATSAEIPVSVAPPGVYALWTVTTIPGHVYNFAVTYPTEFYGTTQYGFETINGGTVVAIEVFSDTGYEVSPGGLPTSGFSDPGQFYPDGTTPVPWKTISDAITAIGTTTEVRITGATGYGGVKIFVDGLRVQDATAGTITYYNATQPELQVFDQGNNSGLSGLSYGLSGTLALLNYPTGIGSLTTITPSGGNSPAQVLQAALEAMPSIGVGNVLVDDGTPYQASGNYQVTFAGTLGNAPQPLLSCSDSHVAITEVTPGGIAPMLSINGGPAVRVTDWLFPSGLGMLHQSAPASRTFSVYNVPWSQSNFWDGDRIYFSPTSVSGSPDYGWSPNLTMSFALSEEPPGTYQFAVTYPTQAFTDVVGRSYVPSTATQFLLMDGNGNTLKSATIDQTQALNDYTTTEASPNQVVPGTITVPWKTLFTLTTTAPRSTLIFAMTTVGQSAAATGQTQHVAILDAIQVRRTSPDHSVVIQPGDVATLSIPANWATTQAGPVPAIANLAITPPSTHSILPAFVDGPRTMEIGQGLVATSYASTTFTHSNLFFLNGASWSTLNSDNYPSRLVTGLSDGVPNLPAQESLPIVGSPAFGASGDPWQGTVVVPSGLYIMTWDGDPSIDLHPFRYGTSITNVTGSGPAPAGARQNWRIYLIQSDPTIEAGPQFSLTASSTTPDPADTTRTIYMINLANVEIYPPDPADLTGQTAWGLNTAKNAWTRPPTFHPNYLDKFAGLQTHRMMDVLNTNMMSFVSLDQIKPVTNASRCVPMRQGYSVPVATIQAPTNPYFPVGPGSVEIEVHCAEPHHLWDGVYIAFGQCGTAQLGNGGSTALDSSYATAKVVDATTLACYCANGNGTAMTNVLTGGFIATSYGTLWPLEDIVEHVNLSPDATSMHFHLIVTADTTPGGGAYQIGAKVGTLLRSGVKVHLEISNEAWNGGFIVNEWCGLNNRLMGNPDGTSYEAYYVTRAKMVHDQFQEGMASVGRGGDVVRILGSFAGNSAVTDNLLQQAQKIGMPVDEVCVDGYFFVYPVSGYTVDQLAITNAMTVDQLLDWQELTVVQGSYTEVKMGEHLKRMQARGYGGARLVTYEGSMDLAVPVDPIGSKPPGNTPNFIIRQQSARRHPRMYGIMLQKFQAAQDIGLGRWTQFEVGSGTGPDGWDTWEGTYQRIGTGDPIADGVNITNPMAKNQTFCEVGGALNHWASLVQPSTTSTTNSSKFVVGRNGMIRATGFPRGVFRTLRGR